MTARGGKRPGAGRKQGAPNKATAKRQKEVAASGLTPLDFMLTVLRDEAASMDNRMWAAEKAAPYVHAKLASVEVTGKDGGPLEHHHKTSARDLTDDELATIAAAGSK